MSKINLDLPHIYISLSSTKLFSTKFKFVILLPPLNVLIWRKLQFDAHNKSKKVSEINNNYSPKFFSCCKELKENRKTSILNIKTDDDSQNNGKVILFKC